MASIFAQMGYDGEFFARIDWMDKLDRMTKKTAEMIWHGSPNLGNYLPHNNISQFQDILSTGSSSDLFTGVLYNHYSAPPGFCFDILCEDDPIIDSEDETRNVEDRVDTFIDYVNNLAPNYRTNHVLLPMGDDFNYQNANVNFKNMDKLIK